MNSLRKLLLVLLLPALAGCETLDIQRASQRIDDNAKITRAAAAEAQVAPEYVKYTGLVKDSGFWIGGRRIKMAPEASQLPESFKKQFTLASSSAMSLSDLAEKVTLMTGVPVQVNADVTSTSTIKVNYSGPLSGFLDAVAARHGVNWKYAGGSVIVYRMDSKTWYIKALPGDTSLTATVSTSSSASGSSSGVTGSTGEDSAGTVSSGMTGSSSSAGSGAQTATYTSSTKVWTEVESTIKSQLSKDGKVIVSPGTSSVTVTDTKTVLESVDGYIRTLNKSLSRQAVINVKVYAVSLNDGNQNGIDWTLVYAMAKGSISVASPFAGNNASSLTASILNSGHFNGTSAIVKALETQGKVSLMTTSSTTTLNSQPVPVQVARQTGYLSSISTTISGTSGASQTSLTPGTITTGFNMNLLPAIYNDGRMLLQYAISISDLAGLTSVSSNGQTIQVPEINTRNFLQRVGMKSGQTLVLSGFERMSDTWNRSQMFKTPLTGGGYSTTEVRDVIVIVITPIVIEDDQVI